MQKLFNGDFRKIYNSLEFKGLIKDRSVVVVTDPPFNIGYKYSTYNDKLSDIEYLEMIGGAVRQWDCVLIHYPEALYKISMYLKRTPDKVVAWVYNGHTPRQHRDICFFGITPKFNQVLQEYKNPKDKRIQKQISQGKMGAKSYDWWMINQVKNTSKEKTHHPCQMPIKIMENIIGVLPKSKDLIVVDPFMGSGTTGEACIKYGVDFIGIELDGEYFSIAKNRINNYARQTNIFDFIK